MSSQTRLADVLPQEFMDGEYEETSAMRLAFIDVIAVHSSEKKPWPGSHRFVSEWYVLANGKAVGFNRNPRRWSFPVIRYHDIDGPVMETYRLRFMNAQHQRLHHVLMAYGFDFSVSSDLRVGLEYMHPERPVQVLVKQIDDDLEYVCLKPDGRAYDQADYTRAEWTWIDAPGLDDVKRLERDLYALIKMRPNFLHVSDQVPAD